MEQDTGVNSQTRGCDKVEQEQHVSKQLLYDRLNLGNDETRTNTEGSCWWLNQIFIHSNFLPSKISSIKDHEVILPTGGMLLGLFLILSMLNIMKGK